MFNKGELVKTKKEHPCKNDKRWIIEQVGDIFKLKCEKCSRIVELPREKAEKIIVKKIN